MSINLKSLVEDIINELTQKATIDYKNPQKGDKVLNIDPADDETINNLKTDSEVQSLTIGTKKIKEAEIDEMAAPAVEYEINDLSKVDNLKLSPKALDRAKKLAAYVDAYGPVKKSTIAAKAFDTPLSQQQINSLVDLLVSTKVLKIASGSEARAKQYAQSYAWDRLEKEKAVSEPKDTDVKDIDIDASIASFPKGDGEEEPEIKAAPSAATTVSPARKAAIEFFYDEKNERLLKKIINTYSASRTKIKEIKEEIGDIGAGDFKKGEIGRKEKALSELDTLIQTMADRIKAVGDPEIIDEILKELSFGLNSIGYAKLYSRIEKMIKEEQIDEWTKGKLQYYAGINP